MSIPFFSVVIPTKNRSFIVGDAVQSVLRQTFTDFEVVVVDNDDGDATTRAVSQFKDPRLRIHRTGGLSMPDNWEAACAQARGEYLLIIEDKQALRRGALSHIQQLIQKHQPACLKWQADTLDDTTKVTWVEKAKPAGGTRFIPAGEILRTFLSADMGESWCFLPVGHLSAFSRSLRNSILSGPAKRLCPPVSPDYTLGIQSMAFCDGVLFVDEALVAMSRRHSNGRSLAQKTALGQTFMKEIGGADLLWSRSPIQAPIIPASLFNDYLELQAVIGGRLQEFPLDWINYYVESWRSLIGLDNAGIEMTGEFGAFYNALAKEPMDRQKQVWAAIEKREGAPARSLRKNRIKKFRRRTGLLALEREWKLLCNRLTGRRHIGKFSRPLDFVIWADEQALR